ncbi:type IX secretion system membrane protein PorP/SprF [Labilibaculum sp. DW002]|uniref:Type IX secretion system membrane protein PorP/SprF n=1 Tax=Paralabilibaculum antarcticum TaxID=2912572 RepID=A0ABT5VXK1_9BACT|nr:MULTISPECIES: type IX secretion system membrane protein PorP/SprF [unclassified Labilibaculum]MBI9057828.1 type IX secretion system membrane protein PorP/SprF [Labilibaculum sp.]MDE5419248.1 type IX secretion system membrane protein PorP/SprF [Labilibaculum sp. DW002]|eukprot:TRINITY_DN1992_c0_g1_i2.p1 TRINITY_DN1992_c0_g1~~TRINITY_DN1992_c0_g1_i2.p1  ORF type:complete len:311 (+),score=31.58 TRINITY_DN1992_c0_g1_i2:88-1020(+)
MKKFIFFILLACSSLLAKAQQDPQFSQNMFNILSVNPAFAGSEEDILVSAINRQQWVGFDNAPVSTVVNVSTPISFMGADHGIGLTILSDKLGFEKNTAMRFSYAYQKKISTGSLNIGVSVGFQNNSLKGEWFVPTGDGFVSAEDDLGAGNIDDSKLVFDLGLGFYYHTNNFYVGTSVSHLNKPNIGYNETVETYLARHYYGMAGYRYELNESWEILPSIFYKTDAVVSQFDLNTNIRYNKRIWGGVSYRVDDAIVGMLGVLFNNGIQIGYAYDISTSKIAKGSHEFLLAYRFNTKLERRNQKYKSIRFL